MLYWDMKKGNPLASNPERPKRREREIENEVRGKRVESRGEKGESRQ